MASRPLMLAQSGKHGTHHKRVEGVQCRVAARRFSPRRGRLVSPITSGMPWAGVHALVQRARAGDRNAWTDLHAMASDYLLGLAQKLLGPGWPHESAHDLTQEVWVKFCANVGEFRGGADDAATAAVLRAWLGKT